MGEEVLAEQLRAAVSRHEVTGASLAYWDGSTLHTAVAGVRNSTTGDPVTVDTVMHVGSITKVFNTALLMRLVEEGRIKIEDPIAKHLPKLRLGDPDATRRITCAMLVNHTSGIDCSWVPGHGADYRPEQRIVDAIESCADVGQLFSPGKHTSYCNGATVIAGYLVQALHGQSWYTLIKERIFEPLEMRHALADPIEAPRFRCSVGDMIHPLTGVKIQASRPFMAPSLAPCGTTLMMSAADLVTFGRTLLAGGCGPNGERVLAASSTEQMATPTTAFAASTYQVGLGWMIAPGNVLTHSGGGPGVRSSLYAHAASGRVLALLTNCGPERSMLVERDVTESLVESWTGTTIDRIHVRLPGGQKGAGDLSLYVGAYEDICLRVEILRVQGGLCLRQTFKFPTLEIHPYLADRPALPMQPVAEHTFEISAGDHRSSTELRFLEPNGRGGMQYLAMGLLLLRRA